MHLLPVLSYSKKDRSLALGPVVDVGNAKRFPRTCGKLGASPELSKRAVGGLGESGDERLQQKQRRGRQDEPRDQGLERIGELSHQ